MDSENEVENLATVTTNESESRNEEPTKHCCHVEFHWNQEVAQYGDKLLQRLNEFRKKNMFYDVILKANDCELAAHKVVLAACGGMFRSHFVDSKTKMISSDVREVEFSCSSAGLKPILQFAYTGVLEINHANVLDTLQAAIIAEMKEVQEICADLAWSRFGWILPFDGSPDSLQCNNPSNSNQPDNVQDAFAAVKRFVEIYSPSFQTDNNGSEHSTEEVTEKVMGSKTLVTERLGDLQPAYKHILDILCIAQNLMKAKSEKKQKSTEPETVKIPNDVKVTPESLNKTNICDKPTKQSVDESASPSPPLVKQRTSVKAKINQTKIEQEQHEINMGEKLPHKPITKPRSVTAPIQHDAPIKVDSKTNRPPTPPKDPPKPRSATQATPNLNTSNRRKTAAPKPPPTPPPNPTVVTPPNKKQLSKTPTAISKSVKVPPPRPAGKIPPPRPKPPSIKKKSNKEIRNTSAPVEYNEALNPFSVDEETEVDHSDLPTNLSSNNEEGACVSDSTRKPVLDKDLTDSNQTYDSSLNPFD